MILCNADKSGCVLAIRYSQRVGVEEMRHCVGKVRELMGCLKPGFLLLTDLSNLKWMDAACATELGAIMDLCSARGVSTVVRVIPDPAKDIGFNVISRFHLQPQVKTRTYASLAEAIKSLLTESSAALPTEMAPT